MVEVILCIGNCEVDQDARNRALGSENSVGRIALGEHWMFGWWEQDWMMGTTAARRFKGSFSLEMCHAVDPGFGYDLGS